MKYLSAIEADNYASVNTNKEYLIIFILPKILLNFITKIPAKAFPILWTTANKITLFIVISNSYLYNFKSKLSKRAKFPKLQDSAQLLANVCS